MSLEIVGVGLVPVPAKMWDPASKSPRKLGL